MVSPKKKTFALGHTEIPFSVRWDWHFSTITFHLKPALSWSKQKWVREESKSCSTTIEPTNHCETNRHVDLMVAFTWQCTEPNKCSLLTMSSCLITCQNLLHIHKRERERERLREREIGFIENCHLYVQNLTWDFS